MKTVIDAVNELEGDLDNGVYTEEKWHSLYGFVGFDGGDWVLYAESGDEGVVTSIKEFNQCAKELSEWRPRLPSIPTETKEEKEALDKIGHNMLRPREGAHDPIKPVYTKAMQEAGELPPVGSEAQFFSEGYDDEWFDWCIFHGLATCGGYIIEHHHRTSPSRVAVVLFDPLTASFKPIQTEREKAIDKMIESIRTFDCEFVQLNNLEAGRLYDAGYRLQSTENTVI